MPRLNLEMAAADEIVAIACEVKPHEATLVPEKRARVDDRGRAGRGRQRAGRGQGGRAVAAKPASKCRLFIDPDIQQIDVSKALGATAVEFQTARYSEAKTAERHRHANWTRCKTAAVHARDRGLHVHAGHGLNYTNVQAVARIPGMEELNIGHSIVSRAVLVGMERAVREMKEAIRI